MDLIFNCPHCEQELAVDDSAAGSEIECPSCSHTIVIPATGSEGGGGEGGSPPLALNPISTSAAAREERHFAVPQHETPTGPLIAKPLKTLEAAAKGSGLVTVKTFRRSDCVEVGKDNFDQIVSKFLQEVGDENLVSLHPITYSHQDLASHQWISDYGIIVIYKA